MSTGVCMHIQRYNNRIQSSIGGDLTRALVHVSSAENIVMRSNVDIILLSYILTQYQSHSAGRQRQHIFSEMDLWRYEQTRLHPHCAGGLLDTEHAASTHLHKIETGQQADTVFGQDPLLSRRHGQASRYLNKFQDVTTKECLSSPAGVLS